MHLEGPGYQKHEQEVCPGRDTLSVNWAPDDHSWRDTEKAGSYLIKESKPGLLKRLQHKFPHLTDFPGFCRVQLWSHLRT